MNVFFIFFVLSLSSCRTSEKVTSNIQSNENLNGAAYSQETLDALKKFKNQINWCAKEAGDIIAGEPGIMSNPLVKNRKDSIIQGLCILRTDQESLAMLC